MKYIIKNLVYNTQHLSEDQKSFSQDVTIELGIEGDSFGFSKSIGITIPDVSLSLGEEIISFVEKECQKHVDENYNLI